MKNITITLDGKTASWVRVHAAERGMSVSRLIGELLGERMRHDREYAGAMQRFLARKPVILKRPGERYAARDDLHDRTRLR